MNIANLTKEYRASAKYEAELARITNPTSRCQA